MAYQPRDLSGSAFKNDRKREGKKDPEYTGSMLVRGEDFWLDIWIDNNPRSPDYDSSKKTRLSLSLRPKDARPERPATGGPISSAGRESARRHMPPPPLHQPAKPESKLDPQDADGNYTWDAQEK